MIIAYFKTGPEQWDMDSVTVNKYPQRIGRSIRWMRLVNTYNHPVLFKVCDRFRNKWIRAFEVLLMPGTRLETPLFYTELKAKTNYYVWCKREFAGRASNPSNNQRKNREIKNESKRVSKVG